MRLVSIILAFGLSLNAYAQDVPSLKVAGEELADYLSASADSVAAIMVKHVLEGRINAFHDAERNTAVPPKEVKKWKLNLVVDEVKIPDAHDPNNLKDTIIEEERYIPEFRYIIMDREMIRYYLNDQKQFYVNRSDLEPALNTRFLAAYSKVFGDTMRKQYDDEDARDVSRKFAAAIHEQVLKGKIKAYRENSLRSMIPVPELQKLPATSYTNDSAGYFQAYFKEETIGRVSKFRCNSLAQCSKAGAKPQPAYYVSRYDIESGLEPEYSQLLIGAVNFTADNAGKK